MNYDDPDWEEEHEIEFMGMAVICDQCERRISLPAASTKEEAIEDTKRNGFVVLGKFQFCSEKCKSGFSK